MGINPTPTNHRSFTFDGKSTREFGVYITGEGVFNAPERAVEMISIPGRDGEYALDQGHFNNIEVTYRAGIVSDSTTDFAEAISNFRNWLASRKGYCRLTDEYNTEEYRMAVFKNAIALEHKGLLTGEFDVTFDCKPQRYLAIGEELTEIGAWGNTETVEGDIVTIEAESDTAVKALTVDIVPVQSGSGTPSPDNVRPISGHDEVGVSVVGKNLADAYKSNQAPSINTGQLVPYNAWITDYIAIDNTKDYCMSKSGNDTGYVLFYSDSAYLGFASLTASYVLRNSTYFASATRVRLRIDYSGDTNPDIQLEQNSTATTYEPYNGTTYTETLPSTTYGGTLDVVSGVLTVTHGFITFDGSEDWSNVGGQYPQAFQLNTGVTNAKQSAPPLQDNLSNMFTNALADVVQQGIRWQAYQTNGRLFVYDDTHSSDLAGFKAMLQATHLQLRYELATPQTTQLTPQQVELLLGENNIFADSGNVTVEYGHNPTLLTNPTWFPSKPLLAVEGYGNIGFNKHEINIENVTLGEITLEESLQGDGSVSFYIDTSKVNIGDHVTLNINQFGFELLALTNGGYLESNSLTVNDSNNNFHTTYTIPTPYAWNPYIDFVTTVSSPINLTVGTNATITNTVSGVWTLNTNNTITYSFETVVLYYGTTNHKVVIRRQNFSATISGNDIKQAANISGPLIKLNSATANSTVSALGNPTYIDCDIGECYMIKDDSPISLNQYIDLGSDLPTLPSGDTEVTYDNTITKVEVKPNWWKV